MYVNMVLGRFMKEGKQSSVELSSILSHHEDIPRLHDIHTKPFGQVIQRVLT